MDKVDDSTAKEIHNKFRDDNVYFISAKESKGVDELLDRILNFVKQGMAETGGIIISNVRHLEALQKSDNALRRAMSGLETNHSSELIAMDVRQALHYLGEITGHVTTDDLLDNIFSKFCIGK